MMDTPGEVSAGLGGGRAYKNFHILVYNLLLGKSTVFLTQPRENEEVSSARSLCWWDVQSFSSIRQTDTNFHVTYVNTHGMASTCHYPHTLRLCKSLFFVLKLEWREYSLQQRINPVLCPCPKGALWFFSQCPFTIVSYILVSERES